MLSFHKFKTAAIFVILAAVACQTPPEVIQNVTETPPTAPTEIPSPTSSSTLTPSPEATTTPISAVPTSTVETTRKLPVNWRYFGNSLFGIEMPAPPTWFDGTHLLRDSEVADAYEPLMLWLTDTEETAKRLMAGVPLDSGAYAFGFVGKSIPPVEDPERALAEVIMELGLEDSIIGESQVLNGLKTPSAYVDLDQDPLTLFPDLEQKLTYRLVLMMPETGKDAILVLASSPDFWDFHQNTFSTLTENVELPESNDRVLGHIGSGEAVSGNLIGNISDIWTFNGEEGRFSTIRLTPKDSRMDLTLTLIDPDGQIMFVMDDGYEGDSEALTDVLLPKSGTYIIEAKEFFNENGHYELGIQLSDEAQYGGGGSIGFGQEVSSALVENGEHIWFFQASAGDSATIILSSLDDQLDVILEVYGPTGALLGTWDESFAGDAEVASNIALPITGEYVIVVHGFAGRGGRYGLSLDEGGDSTENLYDAGDLVDGALQREYLREDEVHAWFVQGRELDEITITVAPLGDNMDLELSLVDPTVSEYLVSVDDNLYGEGEIIQYTLPSSGQFIIVVREFFGDPGEYDIALEIAGGPPVDLAGTIGYGETVVAALSGIRPSSWNFEGSEGDIIEIILTPVSEDRDLLFELIDPVGNSSVTVDDTITNLSERLAEFELTMAGQWSIVIREFFGEASEYQLTLLSADQ